MKTIDSLALSRATAKTFVNIFNESDTVAIKFFGNIIGYIKKSLDSEPEAEIILHVLCRKSKVQLKADLESVKEMKIVSTLGPYKKEVVGYLVAA